ncbi:MAG TPA: long-chain-fatty-acid--CoA ligase [Hyphomicrobiaceae bacterium]|jgi:3-(methylthio)propionyl---CoA ligase|nr:long-chain-fatty-acid--CoA ligase [Hyphomicrobiaceae bacterium]
MLRGLMMDRPLLVSSVIDYAAEVFPNVEIVSQTVEGGLHRYGYAQARQRIGRLANALLRLGVKPGDRVATLAWNGYRHFELYFAVSGIGAVCHTINPRLFPEQITYIANHAGDSMLFFDLTFQPLVEKLAPGCKTIKTFVAMTDQEHMPRGAQMADLKCYEDLLARAAPDFSWPEFDEHAACALCYTSGTTGEPKGVLYSNRSMLLHTFFLISTRPDLFAHNRTILPVVPLFHANAWSLPYVTPLTGCPLILPGARLDGPTLFDLMEAEGVEAGWGVPTVWLGLLEEFKKRGRKPKTLVQILSGGSAVPQTMIDTFTRDWGIEVTHGWGMTEMSPVGTLTVFRPEERAKAPLERAALSARQGRRMFGVDLKVIDETGKRAPADGRTSGELFVRGATVVSGYFNNPEASAKQIDGEGWFGTGDVAKLTPDGWLLIVDRTKDLVKSGGEWISSIDVENAALAAVNGIANCAVIGVPHPKWNERPLLVVVKAPGAEPTKAEILDALGAKLAKWQMPDDVVFVEALPMTATGKISKKDLRAKFADYQLPG